MLSTHFTPLPSIAANACYMPVQRTTGDLPFTVDALATDVYAVGKLMARWPDKSIEREFRCAYAVIEQYGSSGDMQAYRTQFAPFWPDCLPKQPAPMSLQQAQAKALHIINTVLASRDYRYLAKMLDWQLQDIYGNPMYRLVPSEYNMQMLIDTLARSEQNKDSERDTVNALIVGPLLPDSGDLSLLRINKFHDVNARAMARQGSASGRPNSGADDGLVQMIESYLLLARCTGMTDEARALNYLLCYGETFYRKLYRQRSQSYSQLIHLISIDANIQYVGERTLVSVIFHYQDSKTSAVESWASTIDVTDEFPFTMNPFEPYVAVFS